MRGKKELEEILDTHSSLLLCSMPHDGSCYTWGGQSRGRVSRLERTVRGNPKTALPLPCPILNE
jgi:hypothetical protein